MNKIVERIDAATGRSYVDRRQRHHLLLEAADEIERLHSLIAAWVDACDSWVSESFEITEQRIEEAENALRKAVGR